MLNGIQGYKVQFVRYYLSRIHTVYAHKYNQANRSLMFAFNALENIDA